MSRIVFSILVLLIAAAPFLAYTPDLKADSPKVVLVTLDGLRWQELFAGADKALVDKSDTRFWHRDAAIRRKKLTPFIWSNVVREGQIYGNRELNSFVNIKNPYRFSYPGYSEILVGYVDINMNSNGKVNNPNKTVLEFVNQQWPNQVAAFASWFRLPEIINEQRSGILVNAAYENAVAGKDTVADKNAVAGKDTVSDDLSNVELHLNETQALIPKDWENVRYDALTQAYAIEYMKRKHPRLVYIAFGETDEYAHEGNYKRYLESAHNTDTLLALLWQFIQSDDFYKDDTTLIITTDHGRGSANWDRWRSHGEEIQGSDETWLIALGNQVPAGGEMKNSATLHNDQVAATVSSLLGLEYKNSRPVGAAIQF